eukprot:scaffold25473_cov57-Phaeocystis_antarctica.AAC.2
MQGLYSQPACGTSSASGIQVTVTEREGGAEGRPGGREGSYFADFLSTAAVWCVPFCLDCSVPSSRHLASVILAAHCLAETSRAGRSVWSAWGQRSWFSIESRTAEACASESCMRLAGLPAHSARARLILLKVSRSAISFKSGWIVCSSCGPPALPASRRSDPGTEAMGLGAEGRADSGISIGTSAVATLEMEESISSEVSAEPPVMSSSISRLNASASLRISFLRAASSAVLFRDATRSAFTSSAFSRTAFALASTIRFACCALTLAADAEEDAASSAASAAAGSATRNCCPACSPGGSVTCIRWPSGACTIICWPALMPCGIVTCIIFAAWARPLAEWGVRFGVVTAPRLASQKFA